METVKINFTLEIEDGFPPIGVETLNARTCDDGAFKIMNTPFFVKETAYDDRVNARKNADGRLEFVECVEQSTFKAISVILRNKAVGDRLIKDLHGKDCIIEYGEFPGYKMLAIAIPHSTDYAAIKSLLDQYECIEDLSYAELVV
jgi:hypothetical protein